MTECNRCGDCCEKIYITEEVHKMYQWMTGPSLKEDYPDRNIIDALFIHDNWYPNFDGTYSCVKFDSETRLCTAHEDRPPVCRDFPWYNKAPSDANIKGFPRCSFWEDLEEKVEV